MKNINTVLAYLYKKAPFQQKKIELLLSHKNETFLEEFEQFLDSYISYLNANHLTIEYSIDAYIKMINGMMKAQVKFMKTGKYPILSTTDAINDVYNNKETMLSYMIGLALSQYLWSTHYEIFNHFKSTLEKEKNNIKRYLEIGPGHGLFLKNAIDILNKNVAMTAIDISQTSLEITSSIIAYFYSDKKIDFINGDMLNLHLNSQFDFIVMGEVIEHVEHPELLLNKITQLLNNEGKAFLSTCVNCPAIDHVYHFKTVDEIRDIFSKCGLKIYSEKVLPVENLPIEEIVKQKITINYSAIVTKA